MPISIENFIYGVTFLFSILLLEGLYYLFSDIRGDSNFINRRMKMLSTGDDPDLVLSKLGRPASESWTKLGRLGEPLIALNGLLARAGLVLPTGRIVFLMFVGSIFVFFCCLVLIVKNTSWKINEIILLASLACSFVIGIGAPLLYLNLRINRRKKQFDESFHDSL